MEVSETKPPQAPARVTTKLKSPDGAAPDAAPEPAGPPPPGPLVDLPSQLALEAGGAAQAAAGTSDFRRQLQAEERDPGASGDVSAFRRQLMAEDEGTARAESAISDFRRQLLEEAGSNPVPAPVRRPPATPDPAPRPPAPAPRPPAPEPPIPPRPLPEPPAAPVSGPAPRPEPPVPPVSGPGPRPEPPVSPAPTPGPEGDPAAAAPRIRELLGTDARALADLDRLERSGLLDALDKDRTRTLRDHLATIATQPMDPASGIDRKRLLADLLHDLVATAGKGLEPLSPREAAIAAGEDHLLRNAPAEYARLVAGLASDDGREALHVAGTVKRPADFKAPGTGSLAASLFEQAFAAKTDRAKPDDPFAMRFAKVLAATSGDPDARGRLGRLLVDGALGSADARGRSTLERLDMLADEARPVVAPLAAAIPDRPKLVADLLAAVDPANGPRDTEPVDPRRLFARSNPADYVRVVSELLLEGEARLRPQAHEDVEIGAAAVAARLAEAGPGTDATAFIADGRFMQPDGDPAFAERIARLRAALEGRPDARTALDLVALRLKLDDTRPLHPERGLHVEDLDRLLALADPATPLADGIDRTEFLASLLKGLATPNEDIVQGNWQTCTVTTLQRNMVDWQPAEYIRIMAALASPDGKVRLARRVGEDRKSWELSGAEIARPADWNASAGRDGRDVAGRLFQTSLMNHAVKGENLATYRQAGFRATEAQADAYDNATDTWTDAFGDPHRGMNAAMLNRLAAELRGDGSYQVEIPPAIQEILARPDFDAAPAIKGFLDAMKAVKGSAAKTWNAPVTLSLTYPDGKRQLHEVLLTTVSDGPPPTATVVDPQDGKAKQMPLEAFGRAIRAISVPDDVAERLPAMMPFLPAIAAVTGATLQAGGQNVQDLVGALAPVLLSYLSGGQVFADEEVPSGLPDEPPPGSPPPADLAGIVAALHPGDTPGRFALDVITRSGMLDQRTQEGRSLLGALREVASLGDPEYFSAALRDLAFGPLEGASFAKEGDAAGTGGRRYVADAGGSKGRRYLADASGSRSRDFAADAGGKKGRRSMPDAGGSGGAGIADAGASGAGQAVEFAG